MEQNQMKMQKLGIQPIIKFKKAPKHKAKPSKKMASRFRGGHWLTANEIEYIIEAFSDATAIESQARPYDLFVQEYRRLIEDRTKKYPWRLGVINTDESRGRGIHWVFYVAGIVDFKAYVYIWDSFKSTVLCNHILVKINRDLSGNLGEAKAFPVGLQTDGWSCGYFAVYWAIVLRKFINTGGQPLDLRGHLPELPPKWRETVWLLCEMRMTQNPYLRQYTRSLGLQGYLSGVYETKGRIRWTLMKRKLDEHRNYLKVC
jgi:hypothetical protein